MNDLSTIQTINRKILEALKIDPKTVRFADIRLSPNEYPRIRLIHTIEIEGSKELATVMKDYELKEKNS